MTELLVQSDNVDPLVQKSTRLLFGQLVLTHYQKNLKPNIILLKNFHSYQNQRGEEG